MSTLFSSGSEIGKFHNLHARDISTTVKSQFWSKQAHYIRNIIIIIIINFISLFQLSTRSTLSLLLNTSILPWLQCDKKRKRNFTGSKSRCVCVTFFLTTQCVISDRQPLKSSDRSLSFYTDRNFIKILNKKMRKEGVEGEKLVLLIEI